jgi:pyruvate ferredoxin oxidoreductase beta subunit
MWMLYEIDRGRMKLTYRPRRRRPVKEYVALQRRFAHLSPREVQSMQRHVDEGWRTVR